MSDYPEHDKLSAITDESQAIGLFLDTCGFILCESRSAGDNGEPRFLWLDEPLCDRGIERKKAGMEPDGFDFANGDGFVNPSREEWREGYYPVAGGITKILADYFEIDLAAIEREKRQMLSNIRAKS